MFEAFPEKINYGDKYNPAMEIVDQDTANAYFERCVEHRMKYFNLARKEAVEIEKQNLGYWAGYFDNETRRKVEKLFDCAHPVFGRSS